MGRVLAYMHSQQWDTLAPVMGQIMNPQIHMWPVMFWEGFLEKVHVNLDLKGRVGLK